MNTQVCTATGRTPYDLVFGQGPRSNYALIKEFYDRGIREEEVMSKFKMMSIGKK